MDTPEAGGGGDRPWDTPSDTPVFGDTLSDTRRDIRGRETLVAASQGVRNTKRHLSSTSLLSLV